MILYLLQNKHHYGTKVEFTHLSSIETLNFHGDDFTVITLVDKYGKTHRLPIGKESVIRVDSGPIDLPAEYEFREMTENPDAFVAMINNIENEIALDRL
jgi:hypothetical protein